MRLEINNKQEESKADLLLAYTRLLEVVTDPGRGEINKEIKSLTEKKLIKLLETD